MEWNWIIEPRKWIFPYLFLKMDFFFFLILTTAEHDRLLLWPHYSKAGGSQGLPTDPTNKGNSFPSTGFCIVCLQIHGTRDTLKPSAPQDDSTQRQWLRCKKWRQGWRNTQVLEEGTSEASGQANHFWYLFTTPLTLPTTSLPPTPALGSLLHFEFLCCAHSFVAKCGVVGPFMLFQSRL